MERETRRGKDPEREWCQREDKEPVEQEWQDTDDGKEIRTWLLMIAT